MASTAFNNLNVRLKDIEQILEAHSAITKIKNAENALKHVGNPLMSIFNISNAIISVPGRGRPKEVDALNRAGFVLLCAHFQGYIDDLHAETAKILLSGKVANIDNTIKLIKPRNSNPYPNIINIMFAGLGVYDLMEKIRWQKCSNKTVKERLTKYIEIRNKIAHGAKVTVTKFKLKNFMSYVVTLSEKLDGQIKNDIRSLTKNSPW